MPPPRPSTGTWEWDSSLAYKTEIIYTCGPFGQFKSSKGKLRQEIIATCNWNKTWTPSVLDPCQGKFT